MLPVFPWTASDADRATMAAEAAKVAALLNNAEEAQKLLLQYLATQDATGQYLVPASDWVAELLRVTKGLSADEIEYLKQLNWKPGMSPSKSCESGFERRSPTANRPARGDHRQGGAQFPSHKGKGTGPGKAGGEGGKASPRGDGPGTPGRDRRIPRAVAATVQPRPSGQNHVASGDFGYVILSGISGSSKLARGRRPCARSASSRSKGNAGPSVLDHVSITFDSRKDGNTVNLYFTNDFWSQKYKFHGLGGKETMSEYSFGSRRSHKK